MRAGACGGRGLLLVFFREEPETKQKTGAPLTLAPFRAALLFHPPAPAASARPPSTTRAHSPGARPRPRPSSQACPPAHARPFRRRCCRSTPLVDRLRGHALFVFCALVSLSISHPGRLVRSSPMTDQASLLLRKQLKGEREKESQERAAPPASDTRKKRGARCPFPSSLADPAPPVRALPLFSLHRADQKAGGGLLRRPRQRLPV